MYSARVTGISATQAFFQLAVAAIPALLFGGAFLESRRKPSLGKRGYAERVVLISLVALVLIGAFAEVVAVRGAVDGRTAGFYLHFVAFVLCAGTVALALTVASPWAKYALPERWSQFGPFTRTLAALAAVMLCAGVGLGFQFWLHTGISRAQFSQTVDGAFANYVAAEQGQSTTFDQSVTAREDALTFTAQHSALLARRRRGELNVQLHQLVNAVDRSVFNSAADPGQREMNVIHATSLMTTKAQQELGGATTAAAVLVTIQADEVKATAVAYIKAVNASQTAFAALTKACGGGEDPRCSPNALRAQGA